MATPKTKPVVEIDKKGKILSYHESAREVFLLTGINAGIISTIVNGHRKTYHGRIWRFARPAEILFFTDLIERTQKTDQERDEQPKPVEELPQEQIEVIPAKKEDKPEEEFLSPFERMLKRGQ